MKVFFRLLVLLGFSLSFYSASGQGYEVSGRIMDASTEEVIPFANIALKEVYKGTASNAVGEFSFKVDSLPVVLVISHLSYEPLEVVVFDEEPVDIKLVPGKLLMDELVIKARGNNNYAYNLVSKAFYKIYGRNNRSHYGKAFYRQISKNGDEYSELYEMFYDTRYSLNGVEEWAIQEGRYALKLSSADSFIYNKNFTLMVRLLTIVQPKTEDLIMPVSSELAEQYDLKLIQLLAVGNRTVAQIKFTKKDYIKMPAMEGDLFIDIDSYHVLKITGEIANDNLNFITLKGENGSWKDYKVNWEIAFKPLNDEVIALDYIRLGQNFDYYYNDVFANKVETTALLTYYEYYTPPDRKKLGGRLLRYNKRDADVLDNIGYNQQFWDENIIVKRTPIESDITASFEAERAFGSIYLNNKNQIILEDYELDKDPFIKLARKKLATYALPRNGDKVYLHHDKPYYVSGEKVWFKAYIVNMTTNMPSDEQRMLQIEILEPEGRPILKKLFGVRDGIAYGQLNLPDNLESGQYTVRAYTDKMSQFSDDPVYSEILDIYDHSDLSASFKKVKKDSLSSLVFYPEGGQVVATIPVQLGYVARDEYGEAINIKGKLVGENGRVVNTLKPDFDGIGSIFMLPVANQQYNTMVMSHDIQRIEFPKVTEQGYSIMVNNLKENSIDVTVRGTMKLEGKKFYMLVISNGILFDRRIGALTRGMYKAEFPKSNLPSGISQILLVDEFGVIRCKRFVFLNQPEEVLVNYYFAKKEFKPRDRIDMVLELNDQNGKSINGANISISVIDKDRIERSSSGRNIKSYLLLDHIFDYQLKNHAELFNGHDRETLKNLDFIMLVQQTFIPDIKSFDTVAVAEEKQTVLRDAWRICGRAIEEESGQPLANGTITLFHYPDLAKGMWQVKCDEDGNFNLGDVYLKDSTKLLVKANDSKGSLKKIAIEFDRPDMTRPTAKAEVTLTDIPASVEPYIEYKRNMLSGRSTARNTSEVPLVFPRIYDEADFVIEIDEKMSRYDDLSELFNSRLQGINYTRNNREASLRIRGEDAAPLLLMDGISLSEYVLGFENVTTELLDSLTENEILDFLPKIKTKDLRRIDVVKPDAALVEKFGMKASHGLIALYSKQDKSLIQQQKTSRLTQVAVPGVSVPEVFTTSDYRTGDEKGAAPRRRATIYWNPNVRTNRKGRAKISFYNSDDARNLQICVEGISDEGVPIFSIYEIGRNTGRGKVN